METSGRIEKLTKVMEAVSRVRQFIHDEIGAVGLAGELAAAKEENAKLMGKVAKLERCAEAARAAHTEPPSPPPARGAKNRSTRAASPLPEYVERRGDKFGCNVQQKGLNFRKGGFATAQAAHDYAVEQIEKLGGRVRGKSTRNKDLPRFVYEHNDSFQVLCNRKVIKFNKAGFATAAAAGKWAEAEFKRKSAGGGDTPHANRPDPGRPRTRAEMQTAIAESRERTQGAKRKWVECVGCGDELGIPGGAMPDTCPKCGSVKSAAMEGRAGADPVEVRE